MAKIIWTEEAVRWMKDIHDYITLDNPNAAQRVVTGIYTKIQILRDFQEIGYIYRHKDWIRKQSHIWSDTFCNLVFIRSRALH